MVVKTHLKFMVNQLRSIVGIHRHRPVKSIIGSFINIFGHRTSAVEFQLLKGL